MANDDHNEILRRGVNFWNDWRRKLSIIPDFSGEHMTEFLHLENANFYRANFKGATFYHNDLSRAILREADLSECNLSSSSFRKANLADANFQGSDISCANLTEIYADGADFTGCNLVGADFSHAQLKGAKFLKAVLGLTEEFVFQDGQIVDKDLFVTKFDDANLSGANFSNWTLLSNGSVRFDLDG